MDIFQFVDYKFFVQSWIKEQPNSGRGQLRKISKYLNVSSVLVSQIINGDKEISTEQALKLCEYLGLAELERRYFISLVSSARAGTYQLKEFYRKEAEQLKKASKDISQRVSHTNILSNEDKSIFYSDWKYSAIRLACAIEGISKEKLREFFQLEEGSFENYFEFLLSRKLIQFKSGALGLGPAATHLSKSSPYISQHHRNWRIKAIESSDKINEDEIMYTAPMCVSRELYRKFSGKVLKLIEELVEDAVESEPEELYYLNIDLRMMEQPNRGSDEL